VRITPVRSGYAARDFGLITEAVTGSGPSVNVPEEE